jgi:N-acetylmuramoyl-L-alanine amidase
MCRLLILMKNITFLVFLSAIFLGLAPSCGHAAELLQLQADKNQEVISIQAPEISPNKVFLLANPDRLVVDLPRFSSRQPIKLPSSYNGTLLQSVRMGQFDPQTTRIVFTLSKPIGVLEVREEEGKAPQLAITIADARNKRGAAIKKPMVVIDAGHGGVDPGAIGPGGVREKDIVLDYAYALRKHLLNTGRYQVKLTRERDYFIMLRKRVDIARKHGAAIFISLHADSAPEGAARGLSVYTVSEQASDKEAEALAARENKADIIGGMNLSHEREDVADILISLAQRETKNRSALLADLLVASLQGKVALLPNTHRFAGFAVLKAPDVPSVLVETGFLSHPKEEKLLKSKTHREKVAAGIAAGVDAYFRQVNDTDGQR